MVEKTISAARAFFEAGVVDLRVGGGVQEDFAGGCSSGGVAVGFDVGVEGGFGREMDARGGCLDLLVVVAIWYVLWEGLAYRLLGGSGRFLGPLIP